MTRLTLTRPDDWHLHLRDGDIMASVLPDTAQSGDIDTTVDGEAVPTKAQGSKRDGFNERLPDAPIQFTVTVLVRNGGINFSSDADDANARIKKSEKK